MAKRPPKTHAQRIHFKRRALQRYGVDVNRHLYRELVEQITSGAAEFIEYQSNRVSVFWVEADEVRMRVIYDKQRHTLVTALPAEGPINWDTNGDLNL